MQLLTAALLLVAWGSVLAADEQQAPVPSEHPEVAVHAKSCPYKKESTTSGCPRTQAIGNGVRTPTDNERLKLISDEAEKLSEKTLLIIQNVSSEAELNDTLAEWINIKREKRAVLPGGCDGFSRYRSFDGSCNNLVRPDVGMTGSVFRRILPASYDDGVSHPRTRSKLDGSPLPSARQVAVNVHETVNIPDSVWSLWLMEWGQFLTHDIALVAASDVKDQAGGCESCDSGRVDANCWPIPIPDFDPYYPSGIVDRGLAKRRCLAFRRSLNGQRRVGQREQVNAITTYIDASNVYGSDAARARSLRTGFQGAMLLPGGLLPPDENPNACRSTETKCFKAGDPRVNQHVALASLHTVWVREHNRIARDLHNALPQSSDEDTYQEARRIVAGMHQHITYAEWLPKVLGPAFMDRYGLWEQPAGYTQYNPNCEATIYNQFVGGAMRFGHSLVYEQLPLFFADGHDSTRFLESTFFDPTEIYQKGFLDRLMQGMTDTPSRSCDRFIDPAIRDKLFEDPGAPFTGNDLISTNIQRGRDHGLQPYVEYRRKFGLSVPETFDDLVAMNIMSPDSAQALASVYRNVNDVDFYTGLIAEFPVQGGVVGPLAGHFIALQFSNLKYCDRFYYEHEGQSGSFSPKQLQQIRSTSLAKVLCANTAFKAIAQDPFTLGSPKVACESLPSLALDDWI